MKNLKIFALVTVAITATYCTKDTAEEVVPENHANNQQEVSPEILSKLESMGFDINKKAPKMSNDDSVLVEGDIILDKKMILNHTPQKQAYFEIISCANVRNMTVLNEMGNTIPGRALAAALTTWNNVVNTTVNFVEVERGPADLTIRLDRTIGGNFGIGTFPSNNDVGNLIRINDTVQFNNRALTQRQWSRVIVHELGHNLGFLHSRQESFGTHVPGTVVNDADSVMNDSDLDVVINGRNLSRNDRIALVRMYSNRRNRLCR